MVAQVRVDARGRPGMGSRPSCNGCSGLARSFLLVLSLPVGELSSYLPDRSRIAQEHKQVYCVVHSQRLLYQKNGSLHILHIVWIVYPLLPFEILVSSSGLLVKFNHSVLGGL